VTGSADLQVRLVDTAGNIRLLALSDASSLAPRRLRRLDLADLQRRNGITFAAGMALQLQLTVAETPVVLTVNIVPQPVVPVPEAAYALLRRQTRAGRDEVECVRFAWSPEPARVELVAPLDLLSEIVRRRAVFQWSDTVRPATGPRYALQKIAPSSSTHVPRLEDAGDG
jgi:hypothetical protein